MPFRHGQAVGGGTARAHHAEAEGLQEFDASAGEQEDGGIEDFAQRLRITRVADGYGNGAALRHLFLLGGGVFKGTSAGDGLRDSAGDAGAFQLRARGSKDSLWRSKAIQQLSRGSGSQTRDEFQCQPVKFFFPAEDGGLHDARLVDLDDNSRRCGCASGRRFLAEVQRAQRKAWNLPNGFYPDCQEVRYFQYLRFLPSNPRGGRKPRGEKQKDQLNAASACKKDREIK